MVNTTLLTLAISLPSLLMGCGGGGKDPVKPPVKPPISGAAQCAGKSLDEGTSCMTLENRDAIVYKPASPLKGIALFLHGSPGSAKKVSLLFDAKSISDSQQLVSVSPQGLDNMWGWNSLNTQANQSNADVDYIVNLFTKLRAENNITSDKVYIFGYSAGGFMGYKLACQIPEQITAFVSIAGQFRGDFNECSTSTPITLHHFHSPQDSEVPINGRNTGGIKSVHETLAHWRLINGCSEISTTLEHPKVIEASEGTNTKIWQDCVKPVSFSTMKNVPHESSYDTDVLQQIYAPIFN